MRTVDPDKHAARRQAILEAATACFAEGGFHRTTTDAICARAGTSSGKLFHYFTSKKALVLAVVAEQNHRTGAWMAELAQRPDPAAALLEAMDGILWLAAEPAGRRLVLEIAAEAARDADVARTSAEGDGLLAAGFGALLASAMAAGRARPVVSPAHAVRVLMVMVDGIFSRVASDAGFDPQAERDAFAMVIRTILGMDEGARDE